MSGRKQIHLLYAKCRKATEPELAREVSDRSEIRDIVERMGPAVRDQASRAERLLLAVAEFYASHGPAHGADRMLSQAARFCAEEWAAAAPPGSRESSVRHWWETGSMA